MKKLCWLGLLLAGLFISGLQQSAIAGPLSSKLSLFVASENDTPLPPDEAFQFDAKNVGNHTLTANFMVAPGHYLYRDRIKFETTPDNLVQSVDLPAGESKSDPTFGETRVFHHDTAAVIHLAENTSASTPITLKATYQGCSEKGLCYSPITKTLQLALIPVTSGEITAITSANFEDDQVAGLLNGGKLWLIAVGFFGFGLLLSLTPCMLPMIPILSGIIVGGNATKRWSGFYLSLTYVLGMAVVNTAIGIAAGLSGRLLSNSLQSPWVLSATALLFVLLALSMFGFYELRLPSALENGLSGFSRRVKGGRYLGVLLMGALSALIVSPCVAAPLAGALLYIAQTGNVALGGLALFALSLGMGVPLLVIGASAGRLLPKAGPWMTSVRQFFGVVMLGVALWIAGPLLPTAVTLGLWAALFIIPAIFLRAIDRLPVDASVWARLWKGIGILLLVWGICMLVGAIAGASSPLRPLAPLLQAKMSASNSALSFKPIHSMAELDTELAAAGEYPVMLDFYADWCVACKEMEQLTFSEPRVQAALKNTLLLRVDVTANSENDRALLKRFTLFGPPAILFFDHGKLAGKVIGFKNAETFLELHHKALCPAGQGCTL